MISLLKDELMSFLESDKPSLLCREGTLQKLQIGPYQCVQIEVENPFSCEETLFKHDIVLVRKDDQILVDYTKLDTTFVNEATSFRSVNKEVVNMIYNENENLFSTSAFSEWYQNKNYAENSLGYLDIDVLKAISSHQMVGAASFPQVMKALLDESISNETCPELPKSCLINYWFNPEESKKLLNHEIEEKVKNMERDVKILGAFPRRPSYKMVSNIADVVLRVKETIRHLVETDAFSQNALKMKDTIKMRVSPFSDPFEVHYEDEKHHMHIEFLENLSDTFSIATRDEYFFMGLIQRHPREGNDYSGCYCMGNAYVIPYQSIRKIRHASQLNLNFYPCNLKEVKEN